MSWTRLAAVARKEIIQVWRDTRSLFIVLIMPVVLVLLFGYGVSLDLNHLPVYVFDRDGTQESQALLKRFQASKYFTIAGVVDDYPLLAHALDSGQAKLGLVIPPDFSQDLRSGTPVSVQALVDASDDNTANVVIGYSQAVVQAYGNEVQIDWLRQQGQSEPPTPLSVDLRTWFNEDLDSSAFIIPGVLALIISVIGAFLTSLTVAREWERGTMEQLVSTPVTSLEIMLGKLVPYFILGLFDAAVCVFMALVWFKVPFRGDMVTLFLASALFLIVVLALGFLISVVAKNQLAASQIALMATFLPAFLLSGFLFAIEQMPKFIQLVTAILPARYYVSALKKIFLKGIPLGQLSAEMVPLAIFALVLGFIATRAFHKTLA